jgi:hypothetical protein
MKDGTHMLALAHLGATSFAYQVAEIGEFPVRDEILEDESGHGYALRMAEANHLSGIPILKKLLGKTRFAVLEETDAGSISKWFGATPEKLALALGTTGIGRQVGEFRFARQTLGRSYFINRMHPRVCASCLRENRYCRSVWEIALATACPRHGVLLLERCPICGRGLSWERPAVDVCLCGWSLTMNSESTACSTLESDISSWVTEKIANGDSRSQILLNGDMDAPSAGSPLARLLRPLTLDGGLHLVHALGTAARYGQDKAPPHQRRKSSISAAQEVLSHASSLVEKIEHGEHIKFRVVNMSVVLQLLAESATAKSSQADRSLAHSLISTLLHQGGRSNWKSRYPQLSQQELF